MMDRHTLMKKGSRVLAIMLAGAMVVSLGADLTPTTEAYAAESQVQYKDEEHHHTDECYEEQETKELICGETESDGTEGHTHTDACYSEERVLNCDKDEHTHSEEDGCYDEGGALICDKEEHTHGDDCYQTKPVLTCDEEESDPTKGHTHTDDCYKIVTEKVLKCGKDEHTHTEDCVVPSNNNEGDSITKNADYDKDYIDAAKSAIDNDNSDIDNLIAVAASQAGYTQQIVDDTENDGYTLYGNWYSNGKNSGMAWDAAYVVWCLDKVGIDTERDLDVTSLALPVRSDLSSWIKALQAKEDATLDASDNGDVYNTEDEDSATIEALSLYIDAEDGIALTAGDIAFLDLDQNGKVDHVGIVASTDETEDESTKEIAIYIPNVDAGTLADYVDDTDEDADPAVVAVTIPGDSFDWDQDDADTAAQDVLAETVLGYIPTTLYAKQVETITEGESGNGPGNDINTLDVDPVSMTSNVTALTGDGTKYDADGNVYSTSLRIDFSFNQTELAANKSYYYNYPDGVIVPDNLLNTPRTFKDENGVDAGTYEYKKNSDGTYRVVLVFNDDYVSEVPTGASVKGHVEFAGQIRADKGDDGGSIKIDADGNVDIVIPADKIDYPDGQTQKYDIATTKTGSYSSANGKITYTVYVKSIKGTPGDISYTDTIKATNVTLGEPTVTVTKQTIKLYGTGTSTSEQVDSEQTITPTDQKYDSATGQLTMTLPQIDKYTDKVDENKAAYRECTYYKVVYTYDVSNPTGSSVVNNKVTASSKNANVEIEHTSETTITWSNTYTIYKSGSYKEETGRIEWTISINSNKVDIAGSRLTDDMLAKLAEGTNVTVSPNSGYEIEYDATDSTKITGIKFTGVNSSNVNKNAYTIKYETPVTPSWDDQTIINKVIHTLPDSSTSEYTGKADVPGGRADKTVGTATESNGKITIPWTVTITIPSSGIPSGTVITDDATQDQWGTKSAAQYMTREQVIDWADGMTWVDKDGGTTTLRLVSDKQIKVTFLASDGNTYTYDEIQGNTAGKFEKLTYTVYTIELGKDLVPPEGAKQIVFKYSTTADVSDADVGTTKYYNTVQVDEQKKSAEYDYKRPGLIKTDETGATDKTTKKNVDTLSWKIKATLAEPAQTITIEDTLPEGLSLETLTAAAGISGVGQISIGSDGKFDANNTYYRVYGSYDSTTRHLKATITLVDGQLSGGNRLPVSTDGAYELDITCKINKDQLENYENGKVYTFTNSVSGKVDNAEIKGSEQSQEWSDDGSSGDSKVLDKTGTWDTDSREVQYQIQINPEGKDLLKGAEVLTLKDVLTYYDKQVANKEGDTAQWGTYDVSAELQQRTVHLYKAQMDADGKAVLDEDGHLIKGAELTNWSWTVETSQDETADWRDGRYHTSTITAKNIPDETPLILEYTYKFSTTIPKGYESQGVLKISNIASLEGTDISDEKTQDDSKWSTSETSAEVTTEGLVLHKVATGNFGIAVKGAKFKLQRYVAGAAETWQDVDNITYESDDNGLIQVKWNDGKSYERNVLYRMVETEAPSGYIMPDHPENYAIYFYFSIPTDSTETTENVMPSPYPSEATDVIDLTTGSGSRYVENDSETTSIEIDKKWLTYEGDRDLSKKGSITVDIYRTSSTVKPTQAGDATLSGAMRNGTYGNYNAAIKTYDESSHPAGTVVSFTLTGKATVPAVYVNDSLIQPTSSNVQKDEWGNISKSTYEYSFTMTPGMNTVYGYLGWNAAQEYTASDLTFVEPTITEGEKYQTVTVSSDNDWKQIVSGLPLKGKNSSGQTVYYSYYVEESEESSAGYDVTTSNNDGITSGTITITNKSRKSYELPSTGGMGTLPYTLGGSAALISSMFAGCSIRRRRRDERRCD